MKIGEQIALQRKRKGITQEALSETSGISLRTIQRIENGRSIPRAYTLKILADQLQMDLEKLTEPAPHAEGINASSAPAIALQQISSAGLTVLLLPVLPVLITLFIWIRNNKNNTINAVGKRIISFQLIWLIATAFALAFTQIIFYYLTGAHIIGHFSPLPPVYLLMLLCHSAIVICSASKVQNGELGVYRFVPVLF